MTRLLYPLHVLGMFWFVKCMLHRTGENFQWMLRYISLQVART